MAELMLFIDRSRKNFFEDGDILCSFNDNRISRANCEYVASEARRSLGFNGDGLRVANSILEDYLTLANQYKFVRISTDQVKRVETQTGEETVIPKEEIAVAEFIKRRKVKADHCVFGTKGNEYWFGKSRVPTESELATFWNVIETKTAHIRSQHLKWKMGSEEYKSFLQLQVTDFSDARRTIHEMDTTHKKRICHVPWQDFREISRAVQSKALIPTQALDVREFDIFVTEEIINFKGLKK